MIPYDLLQDYFNDNDQAMRNLITLFLNLVMQMEANEQAGANPYERTDARKANRNGYKDRSLKTRYGEITLNKPHFREFPFETEVFGKYSRVEKALVNTIAESYLQGVSTRKVQNIVSYLGIEQLSPSSVSRISKELDEHVHEFLNRPIESKFPYIFVDATYFSIRDGMHHVNKALLITTGVREDGYREILGAKITDCENEAFWSGMFDELKERGLDGVKLVVSDGHSGIKKAVSSSFLGASWQMCLVHLTRAVMRNVPKKYQKEFHELLKESLHSEKELQKAADILNERGYRKSHWIKIRTTNGVERINKELKRRSRVIGSFPNDESLLRLSVSILIDMNEEWLTGRRYLSMEEE